jgi:hypothetical protein
VGPQGRSGGYGERKTPNSDLNWNPRAIPPVTNCYPDTRNLKIIKNVLRSLQLQRFSVEIFNRCCINYYHGKRQSDCIIN